MTLSKILVAFVLALVVASCGPSIYTDIRANGDGTYTMTMTRAGGRVHGEVLHCTPNGPTEMVCQSIDRL